ncbi:hypothetical protein FHS47_002654 [Lutibacter sp. SG786]|nr:hypothetical protein [Luteibacter sp. SG786]
MRGCERSAPKVSSNRGKAKRRSFRGAAFFWILHTLRGSRGFESTPVVSTGSSRRPRAWSRQSAMHRSVSHGPLVSTLAAQTGPPRSKRMAAAAAHVLIGLRPLTCAELASRVDTKDPSGRCGRVMGERRASEATACASDARGAAGGRHKEFSRSHERPDRGSRGVMRRCNPARSGCRLRPCRLSRHGTSCIGRVFGVHPRGEFRTSERPKADKNMGRVSGPSFTNAEDLSEQRGWTPKTLALPSEQRRRQPLAPCIRLWRMNLIASLRPLSRRAARRHGPGLGRVPS